MYNSNFTFVLPMKIRKKLPKKLLLAKLQKFSPKSALSAHTCYKSLVKIIVEKRRQKTKTKSAAVSGAKSSKSFSILWVEQRMMKV